MFGPLPVVSPCRPTGWLALVLSLLAAPLSAQEPAAAAEQRALDSLLVRVAQVREYAELPPPESCRSAGRPLQRLCEGMLTAWRSDWRFGVAARPMRSWVLNVNAEHTVPLGRRIPQKDPRVVEARSRFGLVVTERPGWAPGWWALGLLQLDTEERPDSALRLLTKARALPGLPPGVVDLALARVHYRRGDTAAGWAALRTAAGDTTALSQRLLSIMLGHYFPAEMVAGWEAAPLAWRGAWLERTPGVQDLLTGVFRLTGARVQARSYGLQRADGMGMGVVPFAFARADLMTDTTEVGRRTYRVRVQVTARREGDGLVVVHDTVRVLVDTAPPPVMRWTRFDSKTGEYEETGSTMKMTSEMHGAIGSPPEDVWLGGVVTVPLPPGRWVATLTLTQDGEERGATRLLPPLEVPSGRPEALTMSDLVVSGVNRGVVWWSGREEVPLNPMGTWPMSGTVALYAQVSGLAVGEPYRARVRVLREVVDSLEDQMTVGFVEEAYTPTTVWRRTVQMTDWAAGWYRLVVALEQGGVTVTRSERLQVCAAVFLPVCPQRAVPDPVERFWTRQR